MCESHLNFLAWLLLKIYRRVYKLIQTLDTSPGKVVAMVTDDYVLMAQQLHIHKVTVVVVVVPPLSLVAKEHTKMEMMMMRYKLKAHNFSAEKERKRERRNFTFMTMHFNSKLLR